MKGQVGLIRLPPIEPFGLVKGRVREVSYDSSMMRFSSGMNQMGRRQSSPECPMMFAHHRPRIGIEGARGVEAGQSPQKIPRAWSNDRTAGTHSFGIAEHEAGWVFDPDSNSSELESE